MPYKIAKQGDEFCVVKSDSGTVVKCHPTYGKALAHLRALYVHVEDAAMDAGLFSGDGGRFIDQGFFLDLLTDAAITQRVLAGEPITIIPKGPFVRGGVTRDITDDVVVQFVDNWAHRLDRGIRRRQLAVDVDHDGRAVGWFTEVLPLDGVGAKFRWNKRGREMLQEGEYAYFSPTVYWWQEDAQGQTVENQVGGGALTNYPFFGEATALYGMQAAVLPGGGAVWYAITKAEGGVEYPARAYLVVEDPEKPTTWHLRVYSFKSGKLVLDHGLMGGAKAALTSEGGHRGRPYAGPEKQMAIKKLKALYESEDLDFTQDNGGDGMTGQAGETPAWLQALADFFSRGGGAPPQADPAAGAGAGAAVGVVLDEATRGKLAQVDTLTTQVGTLQTERDTFATRVQSLEQSLAIEQAARTLERFTQMAGEQFGHLPGTATDLASQLAWLYKADIEKDQPHAAYFVGLLRQADTQFARAFTERGHSQTLGGSALERINALVATHQKEHPGMDYTTALSEVFHAHPELYQLYNQECEMVG